MTVEEIKAKYQPRQLENQVEFDAIMSDINQQQGELNRPLIDRKAAIKREQCREPRFRAFLLRQAAKPSGRA